MPVSQTAIDRYLAKPATPVPDFKYMPEDELLRWIYNSTGAPLHLATAPRGAYQLEGLAYAIYKRNGALINFDPRMGKTWIGLNWAMHLKRSRLWRKGIGLVAAHSPLGLDVWAAEAAWHTPDLKIRIVHLDPQDLCQAIADEADLIVVPYSGLQELFSTRKYSSRSERNKQYMDTELVRFVAEDISLVIADEIHMMMHHTSLRFQIMAMLTQHCNFRLGMTGTPMGRNPFGWWAQAFIADRGEALGTNYFFFEQAFGIGYKNRWSKRWAYKFDDAKMPLLVQKLSGITFAYERREVRDETIFYGEIKLHMYGDQLEAYGDCIDKLIKLANGTKQEVDSTFHRLRQISSGYLPFDDEDDTRHVKEFDANPKLRWLIEFVEEMPNHVQVIIFHEYTHTGRMIGNALTKAKRKFGWLYGGTPDRSAVVRDFQQGRTQFLIANSKVGGMSIDLKTADYVLFFESPVSPITRKQAQDRPMARTDRPLNIDDLICSGVDRKILAFLREGRDLLYSIRAEARAMAEGSPIGRARKARKAALAAPNPHFS